jgi:hypothetical protein
LAGDKYLYSNGGTFTEKAAVQTSAGAGDAGKIPALDAGGHFDNSLMPSGIGADTQVIQASEALAAGDLVNVWDNAGAFRVRKADATAIGKEAHGFVRSAVSSGANATVYPPGSTNDQVSGLSPGTKYLSTTPGAVTATAPTGTGNVQQRVGFAGSATALNFVPGPPIVLA